MPTAGGIIDIVLLMQKQLMDWLLSQLPQININVPSMFTDFMRAVFSLDWIFPIHEAMLVFTGYISAVAVSVGWKWFIKIVDWIADVIP